MPSSSFLTQPLLTRDAFMQSYTLSHHATKGIAPLDAHAVFSHHDALTYTSPAFPYVHLIGLLTHYAGSLDSVPSQMGVPTRYRAEVHRSALHASFETSVKRHLGLTFSQGAIMRKFGQHGGSYARVLGLLGFSRSDGSVSLQRERSTKAVRDVTLPSYITQLLDAYPSLPPSEQARARSSLRDVVNAFLFTHQLQRYTLAYEASLFCQQTKENVSAQAQPLCRALEYLYPRAFAHLSPEEVVTITSFERKGLTLYGGTVVLPLERLALLPKNHDLCLRVAVHPRKPQYFYNNRERSL